MAAPSRGQMPFTLSALLVAPLLLLLGWAFFLPIGGLLLTSVTEPTLGLGNYRRLLTEPLYRQVILRTVWIAVVCAGGALLLGYPIAALMARRGHVLAKVAVVCVMIPLWTSALIRSYAWIMLLQRKGVINTALQGWGVTSRPLSMLYTDGAVLVAMTHVLLPFMILPIYSALRAVPADLPRAALNLGAGPVRTFFEVTLPLSLPGVFAAAVLGFARAIGEFGATVTFVSSVPGETETLPLAIYAALQRPGGDALVWRLATISVALALVALVASEALARRAGRGVHVL